MKKTRRQKPSRIEAHGSTVMLGAELPRFEFVNLTKKDQDVFKALIDRALMQKTRVKP